MPAQDPRGLAVMACGAMGERPDTLEVVLHHLACTGSQKEGVGPMFAPGLLERQAIQVSKIELEFGQRQLVVGLGRRT